jgi:hypothetical protein
VAEPDVALDPGSRPLAATRAGAKELSLAAMTGGKAERMKESNASVDEDVVDHSYWVDAYEVR